MALAQIESTWPAKTKASDPLLSHPFVQEVMQQARNDEKFWNEKVLPLQRKLRAKFKAIDGPNTDEPKPALHSRTYYIHADHLGTPES